MVDGRVAVIDVIDTAGQEEYSAMREQNLRTSEGVLCVYAINAKNSFDEVTSFHKQILRVKDRENFPTIIVGNKCDLSEDRVVTVQQGKDLAKACGCKFIETSAKTRINIDEAFYELVREIRRFEQASLPKGPEKKAKGKCSLL